MVQDQAGGIQPAGLSSRLFLQAGIDRPAEFFKRAFRNIPFARVIHPPDLLPERVKITGSFSPVLRSSLNRLWFSSSAVTIRPSSRPSKDSLAVNVFIGVPSFGYLWPDHSTGAGIIFFDQLADRCFGGTRFRFAGFNEPGALASSGSPMAPPNQLE
jgi:hypothetical protein